MAKNVSLPKQARTPDAPTRSVAAPWREKLYLGLLAMVAVAPLPLGASRPLAWEILGLFVAALMIATIVLAPQTRERFPRELLIPALLFAVVLEFAVLQCIPVPASWSNPLWQMAGEGLRRDLTGSISVDPSATLTYVFRLLAYGGVFVLAFLMGRDRARARITVTVIAFAGAVYAVYGLLIYWTGNTTILWYSKWAYQGDLTGTFVNRNSFATYLGLAILACLADLIFAFESSRSNRSKREQVAEIVERFGAMAWQIAGFFLLCTALLLTHSRGGLLATLFGTFVLLAAMMVAPSLRSFRYLAWGIVPLALVIAAIVINGDQTFERLMEIDSDTEGRTLIFSTTWQAVRDFSLAGSGLGSFASIFQIYRPESIQGLVDLAHNDYLQNMLELGIPVAFCLFAIVAWLAGVCAWGLWLRNRDAIFACLGLAATALVASHAMVDFSMQIPAVTVTYLVLLGIAVAQARSTPSS